MYRFIAARIVATLSLAIATIALTLFDSAPAKAYGVKHPFCLQGDEWPGLSNCTFDSYEQCRESAAGRPLRCLANPYFVGGSDDPYATSQRPRAPAPYPYPPRY